jgi:hypothetical protein
MATRWSGAGHVCEAERGLCACAQSAVQKWRMKRLDSNGSNNGKPQILFVNEGCSFSGLGEDVLRCGGC